jgi:hypothetical protein
VVLVEHGGIRTNLVNSSVAAKKSQGPNSPYSQLMQNMAASTEQMQENWSSPDLVAKVVLEAVTSENPSLRYLAGNDAVRTLKAKITMSRCGVLEI